MRIGIKINVAVNRRLLVSLTGIFIAITLLIALLGMTVGIGNVPFAGTPPYPGAMLWRKNPFFWLPYHLAGEPTYSEFELGGKAGIWFFGNYIRITPGYLFILTILYWATISFVITTICYYIFKRIRAR